MLRTLAREAAGDATRQTETDKAPARAMTGELPQGRGDGGTLVRTLVRGRHPETETIAEAAKTEIGLQAETGVIAATEVGDISRRVAEEMCDRNGLT